MVTYTHAERKWEESLTQMLTKAGAQFDVPEGAWWVIFLISKWWLTKVLAHGCSILEVFSLLIWWRYRQLKREVGGVWVRWFLQELFFSLNSPNKTLAIEDSLRSSLSQKQSVSTKHCCVSHSPLNEPSVTSKYYQCHIHLHYGSTDLKLGSKRVTFQSVLSATVFYQELLTLNRKKNDT